MAVRREIVAGGVERAEDAIVSGVHARARARMCASTVWSRLSFGLPSFGFGLAVGSRSSGRSGFWDFDRIRAVRAKKILKIFSAREKNFEKI